MNLMEGQQEEPCIHSNFSCSQTSPTAVDMLLYISAAVVVSLTVCGNLLVIISICHFRQLQTPTNFFLLSLAMTDFLVGVTVIPLYFTILINPQRCFDIVYCTTFNAAGYYFAFVSVYSIALIAVDRCFALSNPFHYAMKMTVNLTVRIISILWLCLLIYNVLFLYFSGYITYMKDMTCGACTLPGNKAWSTIDFILLFVLPFSIIIIMYMNIFAIAKIHANKIRSDRMSQKRTHGSFASERKAAKSLGILVAVFLLCLVPYFGSAFLGMYFNDRSVQLAISVTEAFFFLNSSFNPIIYALFYPWFQRSVKLILTLRICGTDSSFLNVLERDT